MNKRHALLALTIFVSVITITLVFMSRDMATIRIKAFKMFANQGVSPDVIATMTSTPSLLNTGKNVSSTRNNNNATAVKTSVHKNTTTATTTTTNTTNTNKNSNLTSTQAHPVSVTEQKATEPPTNRPLTCQHCFKTTFANLTTIPEVCAGSGSGSKPEMLMLITTTGDGLDRRQAIRETWVSVTKGNTAHIRHVFLLGTDREGKVSPELRKEGAQYGDLLVSDFVDTYGNLTLKTMAALHFLVDHCGEAKFFFKTDQDMYNFPERILELAKKNHNTLETSLGGSCHQTGKPWRTPKTKYYASIRSYPQPTYPGFCSGTGYVGSVNIARKILGAAPDIPFFHLEDVYLALVIRHLGYRLTRYPGFMEGPNLCNNPVTAKRIMTIHELSAQKIRELWAKNCRD